MAKLKQIIGWLALWMIGLAAPSPLLMLAFDSQSPGISDLAWKQDGSQLAIAYINNVIEITDADGQTLKTFSFKDELIQQVAWRPPTGDELAVLTGNALHMLNIQENTERTITHVASGTIAWNADGTLLALAGNGNGAPVYILDGQTLEFVNSLRTQLGEYISPVSWSPVAPNILATGSYSGILNILDISTGEVIYKWQDTLEMGIYEIAWRLDAAQLAVASHLVTRIWDTSNWELQSIIEAGRDMSWQPDGQQIALVLEETLTIFDTLTGDLIQRILSENDLYAVAWHPDGSTIHYGGVNNSLQSLDAPKMTPTEYINLTATVEVTSDNPIP